MQPPFRILIVCAAPDNEFREGIAKALHVLRSQGRVEVLHDGQILAGEDVAERKRAHLEVAQLVLPLLSSDFFANEGLQEVEVPRIFERAAKGSCRIMPVIVRPCLWKEAKGFGLLAALPENELPIGIWANPDEAYLEIASGVRELLVSPGAGGLRFWPIVAASVGVVVGGSMVWHFCKEKGLEATAAEVLLSGNIAEIRSFCVDYPHAIDQSGARSKIDSLQEVFDFSLQAARAFHIAGERERALKFLHVAVALNPSDTAALNFQKAIE